MRRTLPFTKLHVLHWLPLAFVITILFGALYVIVQQSIRLGANEPQLQMATDISSGLAVNQDFDKLIPKQSIDITLSTSPFVIVYDESGTALASSVVSASETPTPPVGVFNYTRVRGEDRLTWEPEQGTRIATIIQHYHSNNTSGFVLVGRNMREVEKNESILLELTTLTWLVALAGSFGLMVVLARMEHRGHGS